LITVGVLPAPLPCFIEDDIARDDDMVINGVIAPVGLGPGFIPDEDRLAALVIELLQVRPRDLEVRDAAESAEVVDDRDLVIPSFIRHLAVESERRVRLRMWTAVDTSSPQKYPRSPFALSMHRAMATTLWLHHSTTPVLLWGIGGSELALDVALGAVLPELHRGEFASPVGAEHLQLLPCLHLDSGMEILDLRWRLILVGEESDPHVPTHVINKKQKILVYRWGLQV
jgi:hypothetical protein